MTHRRRIEVEKMVTDLGLVITGFRTNGNGHWRVDVKTPDGKHQRPFTFPTAGHDGPRRFEELAMLKRWRRQVAPEMEVAEEAGTLKPGKVTPLGEKLQALGIPLKVEQPPKPGKFPKDLAPSHVSDVVLAATAVAHGDKEMQREVEALPPRIEREEFKPGTPEAAFASTFTPQEPVMQTHNHTATPPPPPEKRHYENAQKMTRVQNIRFVDWMRGTGEPDARFKEWQTKTDFCAKASHALGFKVPISALNDYLDAFDLKWPEPPHVAKASAAKSSAQQLNDDIASIALAICESIPDNPHRNLLMSIVERRTATTNNR